MELFTEFDMNFNLWFLKQTSVQYINCYISDILRLSWNPADDCNPGYELAPNGVCVQCPVGTYRTLGTPAVCKACPSDKTTPGNGSTSINDCTLSKLSKIIF